MSINENTALALANATEEMLPALLEQELAGVLEGIDYRPGKIEIMHKQQKFTTPDGSVLDTLVGIILYFHKARGLWLDEKNKFPICSSWDALSGKWKTGEDDNGNAIFEVRSCKDCEYNQFGSDLKGGAGKACKEMRRLFLLEEDALLPSMFHVPPTSLKAFDQYISGLIYKKKAPLCFKTLFGLAEAQGGGGFDYSKVTVKLGEQLPNAKVLELLKMREQVVEAAKKIDIVADDYMGEAAAGQDQENLRNDPDVY